jgi:hypothetical protein
MLQLQWQTSSGFRGRVIRARPQMQEATSGDAWSVTPRQAS